jgi:hypothetical protein
MPLLPLWTLVACSRVNVIFIFTLCTGDWVGPGPSPDGCWKSPLWLYRMYMRGETVGVSSPHQNKDRSSQLYTPANSCRGTDLTFDRHQSFTFLQNPCCVQLHLKMRRLSTNAFFYACQTIRCQPGALETVRWSVIRRVHVRIDSRWGRFEHLLWADLTKNKKKLTVPMCYVR